MNYINFEVGSKTYKLRLNTKNIVLLEKKLGCNPIMIFMKDGRERIPTITEMVTVLWACLQQYHNEIKFDDAFELFDEYLESGNKSTDFISVIVEVYQACGIMPKAEEEEERKNA